MGTAIGGLMGGCEAILLGRKTYTMFEPAWSPRTAADDPGAPFMNDSPKYVVSTTLKDATWKILGTRDGRLFGDDGLRSRFELASSEAFANGVLHLAYRTAA